MDFDDVERRKEDLGPPKKERRHFDECITYGEHKDECATKWNATKEYICLKMKPLIESNNKTNNVMVWVLCAVVIAGAWNGYVAYGNNNIKSEVDHIKQDHQTLKEDLKEDIQEVKTDLTNKIGNVETRFNKRLDEKTQQILDAIKARHP